MPVVEESNRKNPAGAAMAILLRALLLLGGGGLIAWYWTAANSPSRWVFVCGIVMVLLGLAFITLRIGKSRTAGRALDGTVESISERSHKRSGGIALVLFGLVFLVVGCATFFALFVLPVWRTIIAREWHSTAAQIVSSEVGVHSSSDGTTYSIDITYRYTVDGKQYESKRYDCNAFTSSSGRSGKEAVVAQYPAGSSTFCYYDPSNPSMAVLNRDFSLATLVGLFPLIFVLVGAGAMYGGVRTLRPPRQRSMGFSRKDSIDEAAHHGSDMDDPWPVYLPRPRTRGNVGPLVLKPSSSRVAKFAVLLVIAMIFGGVSAILAVQAFDSHAKGRPEWGLTLMTVLFSLATMAIFAGAIYSFLGLFNPTAAIEVDSDIFVLGDSVTIGWQLSGNARRIKHLRIFLQGDEQTTYRRGTSTYTDRQTFAELSVVETSDLATGAVGRQSIRIPPDTMHSFKATHNNIVWRLCVRGSIPRWPDLSDNYDITIAPAAVRRGGR